MTAVNSRRKPDGNTRRCIVTGAEKPRHELIRFVLGPGAEVVPDIDERLPGRGFWLSPERDVVNTALAKRTFSKAARAQAVVAPGLDDQVEGLLVNRCRQLLGLARRAGSAVAGFEKVRAGLQDGGASVVMLALDAAPDSARKMKALCHGVPVVNVLTGEELAEAFGRERTVHALVTEGKLGEKIRLTAAKLAGFRTGSMLDTSDPEQENE